MSDDPFCPHCGYNLQADVPVVRGAWEIKPEGLVYLDGQRLKFSPTEGQMLFAMARTNRPVHREVLYERVGSEAENEENVVRVHISRIKKRLRDAEIPCPFETIRASGYLWVAA